MCHMCPVQLTTFQVKSGQSPLIIQKRLEIPLPMKFRWLAIWNHKPAQQVWCGCLIRCYETNGPHCSVGSVTLTDQQHHSLHELCLSNHPHRSSAISNVITNSFEPMSVWLDGLGQFLFLFYNLPLQITASLRSVVSNQIGVFEWKLG